MKIKRALSYVLCFVLAVTMVLPLMPPADASTLGEGEKYGTDELARGGVIHNSEVENVDADVAVEQFADKLTTLLCASCNAVKLGHNEGVARLKLTQKLGELRSVALGSGECIGKNDLRTIVAEHFFLRFNAVSVLCLP